MPIFETQAGQAMIQLVSYWGRWTDYKDYYLKELAPSFLKDFSLANEKEKALLTIIKANLSSEQWSELPTLLVQAVQYYNDESNRQIERLHKEQHRIKAERKIREENERIHNERRLAEFRLQAEERVRIEAEKARLNEERLKKEQQAASERKKAIKSVQTLFNTNFLSSKRVWLQKWSNLVSEEDFKRLSIQFVINWFEKQGWTKPDQYQAECIAEVWDDVQITARAGSGKTATTVNRAAFLVKHCKVDPSEILLLAFNNKAAKEVKERLVLLLGEKAPQAMTFHALAYAIVHPTEELIFDDETNGFSKSSTVQHVIDSFIHNTIWSKRIMELMFRYFRTDWERISYGGYLLSPEEMVEYRRSMPHLGLDGKHYKSMGEKRIADYLFEHEVPYKYEKNYWWGDINYRPDFSIPLQNMAKKGIIIEYFGMAGDSNYDKQTRLKRSYWENRPDYTFIELYPGQADSTELIAQAIKTHLTNNGFKMRRLSNNEIWHRIKDRALDEFSSIVSQFIGRCRKGMISPEHLVEKVKNQVESLSELHADFLKVVWKIYSEYLNMLSRHSEEDFEGLLLRAERFIGTGKSRWQRKNGSGDLGLIKYLFIDEYQDFSLLFYQLISAVRNINEGMKLFCVGDDWQAINGFAGSDLGFFRDFQDYFPDAKQLMIPSNYRSCKKIINIGNQLMDGLGTPSEAVLTDLGDVLVANINEFKPSDIEKGIYHGDSITPALIRLVYSFIRKGQRVAILCRRRNGLPWYTPYDTVKGKFHAQLISAIRKALPEDMRSMLVAVDTVHSFKGKEEDAIIVVDAVARSYPLIHPRNTFFEILGNPMDAVIAEERRLFYVALSRAKKSLVIVTDSQNESPFLRGLNVNILNINRLVSPKREGTHYKVSVNDNVAPENGTLKIRAYLLENKYRWDPVKTCWNKYFSAREFFIENLLSESWAINANNISITVTDEFDNLLFVIDIKNGKVLTRTATKLKK